MSKGKKKQRGGHHIKFDPAEQKTHFLWKIEIMCNRIAGPGFYELIPTKALDRMYKMRILPTRIMPVPKDRIPDEILRKMRHLLAEMFKGQRVSLLEGGPYILLADYTGVAETLRYYLLNLKDDAYPKASELKKAMDNFTSFDGGSKEADEKFHEALDMLEISFSDLKSKLYWMKRQLRFRTYDSRGFENLIWVHSYAPEQIHVTFDGAPRPATRVTWVSQAFDNIIEFHIKPSQLGIPDGGQNEPIKVYIQQHALQRLKERLDCIQPGFIDMYLCASFIHPVVHHEKGDTFLIEYRVAQKKAGYLVAELNEGNLIVRTFLFVTNGGTPEGKKLCEICGLGRLDREFLAIDKLSTFMATDIKSDKELAKLFTEADCGCLLELHDAAAMHNTKESLASALPLLRKYLGVEMRHDFMMPDILDKVRRNFEMMEE